MEGQTGGTSTPSFTIEEKLGAEELLKETIELRRMKTSYLSLLERTYNMTSQGLEKCARENEELRKMVQNYQEQVSTLTAQLQDCQKERDLLKQTDTLQPSAVEELP